MRGLLNGIYNKVLSFFSTAKEEDGASKEQAYNRLKLVLMHDRAGLSESTLQMMRGELIDVISKYMEIDTEALDLKLESEGESIALMLGIPVIRAKTEEEIQEAIAKAQNKESEEETCEGEGDCQEEACEEKNPDCEGDCQEAENSSEADEGENKQENEEEGDKEEADQAKNEQGQKKTKNKK